MVSVRITHDSSAGVVLSAEHIVDVAKEVIHPSPLLCDWSGCNAELNSWKTLQEHLHRHCEELDPSTSSQPGFLECPLPKCSGRFHSTLDDIGHHIDLSHLSRVLLPCPLQGCPLTFSRNAQGLPGHLQESHQEHVNQRLPSHSAILRPLREPHPHLLEDVPPFPETPIPAFIFALPMIFPTQPRTHQRAPTQSQGARRWKRMNTAVQASSEEEEDIPVGPFPDLVLYNPGETPEITLRPKQREPGLQMSRPQHMVHLQAPRPADDPPPSIGYSTFAVRFGELEKAGIIDGSGVWPEGKAPGGAGGFGRAEAPVAGPEVKKAPAGSL